MIIGRDHAGVGNFYEPFAAQKIFDNFPAEELGIEILRFPDAQYCTACGDVRFIQECGHTPKDFCSLSGTRMREIIKKGERPPERFMRPEVSRIILEHPDPFV